MQYEVNLEAAALLVVAIVFIYAKINYPSKSKKNELFSILCIVVIIAGILDIFTAYVISYKDIFPRSVNIISNTLYFMFGMGVCYLLGLYIDVYIIPEDGIHILPRVKKAVLWIMEIALIINMRFGFFFYVTDDNTYVHSTLFYSIHAVSILFILFGSITMGINFKHLTKVQIISGSIFIVLYILPIVVQVFFLPNTLLIMFGASIIMLIVFFSLETPDYIELQKTMEELEIARKEAENANKAKSQFLARMSHEIRTPINAVLGLDTMIIRESNEEHIKKYAMDIQSSGQNLLSLVNDILDFSKIEAGKMELIYSEYSMVDIINVVTNMIKPKAVDKGLVYEIEVDENMPYIFIGDDIRIKQIIVNLLSNAVKYTHEGSVKLVIGAKIEGESALVSVAVKDTGIGIKKEDIELLSREFVRIEESRNRNIEGTGLGINIVNRLLLLMGSRLEVESVYGEGSKFSFTISQPIKSDEPIGNINQRLNEFIEEDKYESKICIPNSRLLVVDDNAINRVVFMQLLKELQCQIDEAESGMKCLEMVKDTKYDIIFMDHMMPEMDGVETFKKIRADENNINKETPVIVLTANVIAGAKDEYLAEGFNDYLSKPIDVEQLEKVIATWVSAEARKN